MKICDNSIKTLCVSSFQIITMLLSRQLDTESMACCIWLWTENQNVDFSVYYRTDKNFSFQMSESLEDYLCTKSFAVSILLLSAE